LNLLTIADGFGDSVAVPNWYPNYIKWPEIIKLMTKGVNLKNLSRYGAGNEYITNAIQQNVDNCDVALIQWAQPDRLDLVLDQSEPHKTSLLSTIASDTIYSNNIIELGSTKIWLSSASDTELVQNYHSKIISLTQHQMRSQIYINYVILLLEQKKINYKFMLSTNSQYLQNKISTMPWIWHSLWQGMSEFRYHSKFSDLDLGLTQPIPLVHFDFIKQFIMPVMNLPWRNEQEINAVESMLYKKYQEAIKNRPI
jgi:hypothetical protein